MLSHSIDNKNGMLATSQVIEKLQEFIPLVKGIVPMAVEVKGWVLVSPQGFMLEKANLPPEIGALTAFVRHRLTSIGEKYNLGKMKFTYFILSDGEVLFVAPDGKRSIGIVVSPKPVEECPALIVEDDE